MSSTPRRHTLTTLSTVKPPSVDAEFTDIVRRSNLSCDIPQQGPDLKQPPVKVVQISHVACPSHILKLKSCLEDIAPLETLRIIPGTHAVLTDLAAACRALGHRAERVEGAELDELHVTRAY